MAFESIIFVHELTFNEKQINQVNFLKTWTSMALIIWNSKFSVNIKEIDQQHLELFRLINSLHVYMNNKNEEKSIGPILHELLSYTTHHFNTEENLFRKYDYPKIRDHIEEHNVLIRLLSVILRKLSEGKSTLDEDILDFLKEWLTSHIQGSDRGYKEFFNSKGVY